MALWNLPKDDFLSKKRTYKGGTPYIKQKASTSKKTSVKKSASTHARYASAPTSQKVSKYSIEGKQRAQAKEEERKASTIKNACIALVCIFFIVVFLSDFKGCSSSKRSASFELPAFDLSSVIDSIGDAILGDSYSYNNYSGSSYSYRSTQYITDVDLKSDVYIIKNKSSENTITIVCLYQIPEMNEADDYIYSRVRSSLKYWDDTLKSYERCSWELFYDDYTTYYSPDENVKNIVKINSEGYMRNKNDKPLIGIYGRTSENTRGLDTIEGRKFGVSVENRDGTEVKFIGDVAVHEVTYSEMDEIIKGWVKEYNLDEKSKYDTYSTY